MLEHAHMATKRLVLDGEKWRQGLQAATRGSGDTLDRLKRLNAYLASVGGGAARALPAGGLAALAPAPSDSCCSSPCRIATSLLPSIYMLQGLVLDDGEIIVPEHLTPLPWQHALPPPPPQPQPLQLSLPAAASSSSCVSPSDSDIEETEAGIDVAGLLQAAQRAVEQRPTAAAVTIQSHYRRHRAQQLLRQLQVERLAADRLVARILETAYRNVCGPQRSLARQAAARLLRQAQRRRWLRRHGRQHREESSQRGAAAAAAAVACGPADIEPAVSGSTTLLPEPVHRFQEDAVAACAASNSTAPAEAATAAAPAPAAAGTQPTADPPPTAPALAAVAPLVRVSTPVLGAAAARAPASSPPLPRSASSRGTSPAQQQWQREPSPTAGSSPQLSGFSSSSSSSGRQARPTVCPPSPASSSQQQHGPWLPRSASKADSGSAQQYRRTSSIQLLEAVQLGLAGANGSTGGSVASQAAQHVCERTQGRAHELQRAASLGSPAAAGLAGRGGGRISRSGSAVQRVGPIPK